MTPILSVKDLTVDFVTAGRPNRAVSNVSFDLYPGETLGLVGESGCGKSTLGKTIMRIFEPDHGSIVLRGDDISRLTLRQMLPYRSVIQMIFQDPYASLNPRKTIRQILTEPLDVQKVGTKQERRNRVDWLAQRVGLTVTSLERYPHEFSGGQRQRIGIARALALDPEIIVCDEPVSALDVSIQAQVLNLLKDLQKELGLALIFISHDLAVVQYVATRIAVMYLGKIVETGPTAELWTNPVHPFTRTLMRSILVADPTAVNKAPSQAGLTSKNEQVDSGCPYRPRCEYATGLCKQVEPELQVVANTREAACHEALRLYKTSQPSSEETTVNNVESNVS